MTSAPATYPGYRFPAEIIGHAVWLYHVFNLSLRDVEQILAERGTSVTPNLNTARTQFADSRPIIQLAGRLWCQHRSRSQIAQ